MHTEEQARTKWCAHARVSHEGEGNRYTMDTDYAKKTSFACCIASDCMAWRWGPYSDDREMMLVDKATGERIVAGTYWNSEWVPVRPGDTPPEPHGYCGLAGKPELA